MKSLLEILRTDDGDGALAPLPASPGKQEPLVTLRRMIALERARRAIMGCYPNEAELSADCVEKALDGEDPFPAHNPELERRFIDDHDGTKPYSSQIAAIKAKRDEAIARLAKPRSEAEGTSSLKDLAIRNALIAVLKQCDLELERCEDEKCAVCLLAFCIQEIAEKAYYETVGRGGEDDGGASLHSVPAGKEEATDQRCIWSPLNQKCLRHGGVERGENFDHRTTVCELAKPLYHCINVGCDCPWPHDHDGGEARTSSTAGKEEQP